jgi:DNA ligase (NAD+)
MVALIDPVEIDGTIVRRASLKSYRWVKKNKVGIGSVVEVIKGGDIIPKIVRAVTAGVKDFDYPDTCQYCGSKVYAGTAQLFCSNPNCPAIEAAKMYHFLKVLGVKSLAWKSLLKYVQSGITLINFASKNWDVIERCIESNPDISKVVWKKVRNKLEEF